MFLPENLRSARVLHQSRLAQGALGLSKPRYPLSVYLYRLIIKMGLDLYRLDNTLSWQAVQPGSVQCELFKLYAVSAQ